MGAELSIVAGLIIMVGAALYLVAGLRRANTVHNNGTSANPSLNAQRGKLLIRFAVVDILGLLLFLKGLFGVLGL